MTPLEDLIRHHLLQTGPMTIEAIVAYGRERGKTPLQVRDALQRLVLRDLVGRHSADRDLWVAVQP
jgi:hypothetical protein